MAGDCFYSIHPRKATSVILDKKYSDDIVQTAVSTMKSAYAGRGRPKGGGMVRTVSGNALVWSGSVETSEKEDYSTTRLGVAEMLGRMGKMCQALSEHQIITYFSGIEACTYEEDFVVCKGKSARNMVHAAGMQSSGLTAAPAIGVDVAKIVVELLGGVSEVAEKSDFDPKRAVTPKIANLDDAVRAEMIAQNPDYGLIVCRCEEISKGEVLDALRRKIPCNTIDGVKRRVGAGRGRCQGGFCGSQVLEIIAREKGLPQSKVRKCGAGSALLYGPTKGVRSDA